MATIQGIYVALFGRPADPEGLQFWASLTDNGNDLTELVGRLTAEPEALARFDNLDSEAVVRLIYQSIFGRDPDAEGLAHYTALLESGAQSLETIAINILDGATGSDLTVAENKIETANLFTASLDTPEEIAAYVGDNAADIARELLQGVTVDPATIPTQSQVDDKVKQVETGEPSTPVDPTPVDPNPPGGGGGPTIPQWVLQLNAATDVDSVLAVLDAQQSRAFTAESLDQYDDLPEGGGRQIAIAQAILEHREYFGPLTTAVDAREVVSYFTNTEHNKFEFITAVDAATTLDQMVAALGLAGELNSDRRDLINKWANSDSEAAQDRAEELQEADAYTQAMYDIANDTPAELAFLAGNLLEARAGVDGGQFFGVGKIVAAYQAAENIQNQVDSSASLVVDRAAPEEYRLNGDDLTVTIDPDGETTGFARYQGVKITDGGENYDLGHTAAVSATLTIEQDWSSDEGADQQTGIWITFQNDDATLPSGGIFSIAEFIDGDAAEALANPDYDGAGFRFWNSEEGWDGFVSLVDLGLTNAESVNLEFVFTADAHIWFINGVEAYRDELSPNTDAVDVIENVIFNSQNFGNGESYTFSDISLVGSSLPPPEALE